jgi:NTE family protein
MLFPKILAITTALFSGIHPVFPQDTIQRPTIGLVLSGGGAHGIAHLGIIKLMEEEGLRPDYITGVSMGSIIGGMYSLGYSADSLLGILRSIDWPDALSDRISEDRVIFTEKEFVNNSILALPLTKNKIRIPPGLIKGQVIENLLGFYAWPAADISEFSGLPIPFSCLATDLITYKKVELNKGYLPDAMRVSFAVPSIFTPLRMDSLLLVDGGLVRNFAASEVKEMGADIVIGSYVGFNANGEEDLQTLGGIIQQIAMFRSLEDFRKEALLADILISPYVDDLPVTGFENADTLFMRGYRAASPFREKFRHLADSLNNYAEQLPLKNILTKTGYIFQKIEVKGNKNYSDRQILGVLGLEAGMAVDKYMLSERIDLLFGKAWFEKVGYSIIPRNDSLILVLDCIEKPEAMLYGSVHYDNSLLFGLKAGLSVKNLITQRSAINISSLVAKYYRLRTDLVQYIDENQRYSATASVYAEKTLIPSMELGGDRGRVIYRNFSPGFSLGKRIGLNNMMSLNLNFENLDLITDYVSDVGLKSMTGRYLTGNFRYQANTIDRKHFPDKGSILNLYAGTSKLSSGNVKSDAGNISYSDLAEDFSPQRFYILRGSIMHYFSTNSLVTLGFGGELLYTTDSDDFSEQHSFYSLGGTEPLNDRSVLMAGLHPNEMQIKNAFGFRSEMDIELIKDLHLTIMADFFALDEAFSDGGYGTRAGAGIGVGYMSAIGPVKAGVMAGGPGNDDGLSWLKGYISIGYRF